MKFRGGSIKQISIPFRLPTEGIVTRAKRYFSFVVFAATTRGLRGLKYFLAKTATRRLENPLERRWTTNLHAYRGVRSLIRLNSINSRTKILLLVFHYSRKFLIRSAAFLLETRLSVDVEIALTSRREWNNIVSFFNYPPGSRRNRNALAILQLHSQRVSTHRGHVCINSGTSIRSRADQIIPLLFSNIVRFFMISRAGESARQRSVFHRTCSYTWMVRPEDFRFRYCVYSPRRIPY